jgi:hypothetical protein
MIIRHSIFGNEAAPFEAEELPIVPQDWLPLSLFQCSGCMGVYSRRHQCPVPKNDQRKDSKEVRR